MKPTFLVLLFISAFSASAFSQEDFQKQSLFWTTPNVVFDDQEFIAHFHFQNTVYSGVTYSLEEVPQASNILSGSASYLVKRESFSPHIPYGPTMSRATVQLPQLPAGKFTIELQYENTDKKESFDFQVLDSSHRGYRKIHHESPAEHELVSGIGLIRGWACQEQGDIGKIVYQIDESVFSHANKKHVVPYGSERRDTAEVCAKGGIALEDANTGYGAIVNWNLLSAGEHRFRLWVDGHLAADHQFEVAKTKGAFQTGLSKEIEVPNFPEYRDVSRIKWSEADQNFILIDTQKAQ